MRNSCNINKAMKNAVCFALTIGGGIMVTKLILNKVHKEKEFYSVTVNFDEDEKLN